jgi:hypothetical protein
MCDQASETINHLLVGCTFAREFRFCFLSQVDLQSLSPLFTGTSFYDWWEKISGSNNGLRLQLIDSLITLGAWTLWNQRNRCVFDGVSPDMAHTLTISCEEGKFWSMAGARGIFFLTAPMSVV